MYKYTIQSMKVCCLSTYNWTLVIIIIHSHRLFTFCGRLIVLSTASRSNANRYIFCMPVYVQHSSLWRDNRVYLGWNTFRIITAYSLYCGWMIMADRIPESRHQHIIHSHIREQHKYFVRVGSTLCHSFPLTRSATNHCPSHSCSRFNHI